MKYQLNYLLTILSSSGIVTLIFWIFKKKITAGIENSIKLKYDKKLETFKNEFTIAQTVLINSLSNQLEGNKGTILKRINATELLWNDTVKNQKLINFVNTIDTILTIDEILEITKNNLPSNDNLLSLYDQAFKYDFIEFVKELTNQDEKLELLRPYINNELWLLRYFYNLFIGRVYHLSYNIFTNKKNTNHWTKDEYLKNTLNKILTQDEIQFIYQNNQGGIDRTIKIFKEKILTEIRKLLNGTSASENSIEIAMALSKKINI